MSNDWFRHDYNAHDDIKQKRLLKRHGVSALGFYWYLIELLYQNGGHMSDKDVRLEAELLDSLDYLDSFVEFELFTFENGNWSCKRVSDELTYKEEVRQKKAEAGKKGMASRWGNRDNNVITHDNNVITEPNTPITPDNTIPNLTLPSNIPLSVSKETSFPTGKSVSPSSSKFQKPTLEEVKAYCKERKNSVNAEDFINYYDSVGWIVGKGKHMKDWKASVRTWEKDTKAPAPRKDLSDIGVQKVTKIDWGV